MKNTRNILMIVFILSGLHSYSQQEGMISQFSINKLTINAGYAGYRDKPSLFLAHRQQWVGFSGAPRSSILSFDTQLGKSQVGVGGSLIQSKIGPLSTTEIAGYVAVKTRLSNNAKISWGFNIGAQMNQINLADLRTSSDLTTPQDDALLVNAGAQIYPQLGFGMFYYKRDTYFGVSIPKLIVVKSMTNRNSEIDLSKPNVRSVYLMGGKHFKLNKSLSINPNGYFIGTWNSPVTLGTAVNVIYNNDYSLGLYYTLLQSVGIQFQWQMDKQIRISYAMDLATNSLLKTNFGSHEFAINYILSSKGKRIVHPKYF